MVIALSICIVIIISVCYAMMIIVERVGSSKIKVMENVLDTADAIIVLGAGLRYDGTPCSVLRDRLIVAIEVYNNVQNVKILLSGDHGSKNYNEVKAMKKYIMKNSNIGEENIFLDHAGFSTYETMYRASSIFKVNKAIVITDEYHLPRALYIAEKKGIEAYGVSSDRGDYLNINYYKFRERLAQIKDFLFVNIFKPKPAYLGKDIPIRLLDGRITDDEL